MAGRPKQVKANVAGLKKVVAQEGKLINLRPAISVIMYYSGCTYTEIAEVFDISRQMAETLVKNAESEL